MAKKIKGEDGKVYVQKKPFYKRIWFWILVIIVIIGFGGALGGNGDSDSSSSSKTTSSKSDSKSSTASSSKSDSNKITRQQFDSIKLGDLLSNANGGATLQSLKDSFGKPESTSSSTTDDVKTDIVTWTNVEGGFGANVIVSFTDGHAYGKNLTGFKLSRKQKITLSDYNGFENGTKYSDFTAKWGEPDYYDETLIDNEKMVIAGYTSGVKGGLGSNFNATFTNDSLTGKSQSDMK